MTDHKCGTCKHYEAAPMWKKGWCRNPLLYSMQQSHLVGEDDLDCNRGMGSYWEPLESDVDDDEPLTRRFTPPRARTIATSASSARPEGGNQQPAARQSRAVLPPPTTVDERLRPATPLASASPEYYSAVPASTAWGDYLRRGYPVIGVILLLGAFWVWSSAQLGRRAESATAPVTTAPAGSGQVAVIVPSPTVAPPGGAAQPAPTPSPPPGVLAPGAQAVVTTGGAGARIRQGPSTSTATVTSVANGTLLRITGASQDADGYTWWPVTGDGFAGWVAGALIQPAP